MNSEFLLKLGLDTRKFSVENKEAQSLCLLSQIVAMVTKDGHLFNTRETV